MLKKQGVGSSLLECLIGLCLISLALMGVIPLQLKLVHESHLHLESVMKIQDNKNKKTQQDLQNKANQK